MIGCLKAICNSRVLHCYYFPKYIKQTRPFISRCWSMVTSSDVASTFEEIHGVYMMPHIDWNSYSQDTRIIMYNVLESCYHTTTSTESLGWHCTMWEVKG
jgi:hypothetical protein